MKISFDLKTKRFVVDCPFMEVNIVREFPSRRFDPKDKKWRVPLVKQNVAHLKDLIGLNPNRVLLDEHAKQALKDFEALTAAPKITEFPYHVYNFKRSKTGYVPMKHHPKMLDAAWSLKKCAWFAKMGCVAGDTQIQVLLGAGKGRRMAIKDLYRSSSSRIRCRTFKADHFGQHDCIDVMQSGVKEVWELKTSCGKSLKATADHPILTPNGFMELGKLRVGDEVVTYQGSRPWVREKDNIEVPIQGGRSVDKDGYIRISSPQHPHKWGASHYMYEHRLVMEKAIGRYLTPDEHVHHVNGVKHDNRPENLELKSKVDHLKDHGYHKNFTGVKPTLSKVVSVNHVGPEMTYDISMEHPYHNYVASGIVVHNTGKTFGAIHIAFARWQAGLIDKFVIICPSTLRKTWQKELAKYATGDYDFRIHETKASWLNSFYNEPDPKRLKILAVSVEGLGVSEALYDSVCGMYVGGRVFTAVDESSRIKNPKAKRTDRAIQLGAVSDYALIMNGTPISVGIKDLWAQYEFLDPNIIGCGDDWTFKCRYLVMGGYENKKVVAYKNTDELMDLILPYTVEVTKEVLDLPPKVPKSIYIEPTPEQKKLFKLIVKGSVGDPNEPLIKAENTLEKRLRLRQVIGGWLPRGHVRERIVDGLPTSVIETICEPLASNPKMDTMMDIIEDNFEGSKFVIWSPFVPEIEEIVKRLEEKYGCDSVVKYYGAVSDDDRSAAEDRYCTDEHTRFFIGNPSAAGLGLTLISGENDVMIYYSSTDNFIDRQQSEDRCHRIGQKNSVVIMDLIMESSVDILIEASTQQKQDIETFIFNRLKQGAKLDDLLMGVDTLAEA